LAHGRLYLRIFRTFAEQRGMLFTGDGLLFRVRQVYTFICTRQ